MPTSFDVGKYTADYSPTTAGSFVSPGDVMANFGDIFGEIIGLLPELLQILNPTEIVNILLQLLQEIPTLIATIADNLLGTNIFSTLFGGFDTSGNSGGFLTQLIGAGGGNTSAPNLLTEFASLFGPIVGVVAQVISALLDPLGLLGGFTSGTPILSQLIGAGGGNTGATNLLTEFASLFLSIPSLLLNMFGIGGGTSSTLSTVGGNLLSLLGGSNLADPFLSILQAGEQLISNVLSPAGVLSSGTLVPAHTLGALMPGSNIANNVLPDPGFSSSNFLDGHSLWFWDGTVDHTGVAGSGSVRTDANGQLLNLVGVPVAATPNSITSVGVWVRWRNISGGYGVPAFGLCANAYDKNGSQISDPINRVIAFISTPTISSVGYIGADADGWVYLSGAYQAPANCAYVRICFEVEGAVTAGSVWFDDALQAIQGGVVDAGLLGNLGSIGGLPPNSIPGFGGVQDIIGTFSHLFDGVGTAVSGVVQAGLSFSDLFGFMQTASQNASTAISKAASNTNTLAVRTNKSTGAGANPTSQAMVGLAHFGTGGTLSTTSLPAGGAILQVFRPEEVATEGFVEFVAQSNGGTGVYLNIFKWNGTSWDALWNSGDISTQLPSGAPGVVRALIPGGSQPTGNPGDVWLLGLANATSSALTVVAKNTAFPNNPSEAIANIAATRTLSSSGGASPTTLANSALTYSGNIPYFNVGILSVPAGYWVPVTKELAGHGSYTWPTPSQMKHGDLLDVVITGGGGGGAGSNWGDPTGLAPGGAYSPWVTVTLTMDVDVKLGSSLTITVGQGGAHAGFYGQAGHAGTATTVTYTDPSNVQHTITAPGGAGGPAGNYLADPTGYGPGPEDYNSQIYFGGANVGANKAGSAPGGGGGGGSFPYTFGASGADGEANFFARQAS